MGAIATLGAPVCTATLRLAVLWWFAREEVVARVRSRWACARKSVWGPQRRLAVGDVAAERSRWTSGALLLHGPHGTRRPRPERCLQKRGQGSADARTRPPEIPSRPSQPTRSRARTPDRIRTLSIRWHARASPVTRQGRGRWPLALWLLPPPRWRRANRGGRLRSSSCSLRRVRPALSVQRSRHRMAGCRLRATSRRRTGGEWRRRLGAARTRAFASSGQQRC